MFSSFVVTSCSFVALGNNFCKCVKVFFPSLPVSTLYGTVTLAWSDDDLG